MKMMTGGDKSIILKYDRCIFYSCILLLWTGVTKFTVITVVPFTSPDLQLILQYFICLSVHVNGNYRHLFPFCLEMYSLSFFEGLNIVWMQLKAWRSVWSEIESLKNKNIKKEVLLWEKKRTEPHLRDVQIYISLWWLFPTAAFQVDTAGGIAIRLQKENLWTPKSVSCSFWHWCH